MNKVETKKGEGLPDYSISHRAVGLCLITYIVLYLEGMNPKFGYEKLSENMAPQSCAVHFLSFIRYEEQNLSR